VHKLNKLTKQDHQCITGDKLNKLNEQDH